MGSWHVAGDTREEGEKRRLAREGAREAGRVVAGSLERWIGIPVDLCCAGPS